MKKTLAAITVLCFCGIAEAQELKKGNLVGMHLLNVKLEPGVTIEQFTDFYVKKVVPEAEKHQTGWKFYPVRRIRGEQADGLWLIIVIDSQANRDKLYNPDGSPSELGKAINARLQPLIDGWEKLGTITNDTYTDWLVN